IVDHFAILKEMKKCRQRAEVDGVSADTNNVIDNTRKLAQNNPHRLRLRRDLDTEQALNRLAIADVVHWRRAIVQTIGVRDHLIIRVSLGHFFKTAMQET